MIKELIRGYRTCKIFYLHCTRNGYNINDLPPIAFDELRSLGVSIEDYTKLNVYFCLNLKDTMFFLGGVCYALVLCITLPFRKGR